MSQNNPNDPNDPNNQSTPNDQNTPNDPNTPNDQSNPSNQNNPNNPSNQNNPNNQNNPSNQSNPSTQNTQNTPNIPTTPIIPSTPISPKPPTNKHLFLSQHRHYRHLRVYHVTEALYDLTYLFCHRFLPAYGDRTVDQMTQAARSGKQNIAEGNQAAATSSETEIKLTNVAKASLEELLADYEDYLRSRHLTQWDKGHPRFNAMRNWTKSDDFFTSYAVKASKMTDEEMANLCVTLCHQAIYMLSKLLKTMQDRFVEQGGIKERMYAARTGFRQEKNDELAQLKQENEALHQRVEQLEAYIKNLHTLINQNIPSNPSAPSNPNTQNTPNTPNTPSNPSTPTTPTTPKNN